MSNIAVKWLDGGPGRYVEVEAGKSPEETVERILAARTQSPTGDINTKDIFCQHCDVIQESCVCQVRKIHKPDCRFLKAAQLSIELACDHGFQACPECDPCSCGIEVKGIR